MYMYYDTHLYVGQPCRMLSIQHQKTVRMVWGTHVSGVTVYQGTGMHDGKHSGNIIVNYESTQT